MPDFLAQINLQFLIYPFFVFVAIFFGAFLFWRAARHDLIESENVLDLLVVGGLAALIVARIFDFIFLSNGDWTISRLLFFNRYGSFDFWGALVGFLLAIYLFLKDKKLKYQTVLDFAAAPLAFAQALISLGNLISLNKNLLNSIYLYFFVGYSLIFIVLKRLASRKRPDGFVFSIYLI